MSKSLGNVVAPQKVVRHARRRDPAPLGRRDRLLGRAGDLRRDPEARGRELPPHPQHAALPARQHRRLRSRAATRCRSPQLLEIDRYALRARAAHGRRRARADYERYEFHLVVQRLQTFCSEDLGGFYLDILKDRLYTDGARTAARAARRRRRSAHITRRAAAADGADPVVHRRGGVADACIPADRDDLRPHLGATSLPAIPDASALLANWARIRAVRAAVLKELEALRAAGQIGSSLQAEVDDRARPTPTSRRCASLGDDLRFVLITSAARGRARGDGGTLGDRRQCRARTPSASAAGTTAPTSAPTAAHPALCGRCVANLYGAGEARGMR